MRTIHRVALLTVLATFVPGAGGLLGGFRSGQARCFRSQREEKASGRTQGCVSWWCSGRFPGYSAGIHERQPAAGRCCANAPSRTRQGGGRRRAGQKDCCRPIWRSRNPNRSVRQSRVRSRNRHRLLLRRRSNSSPRPGRTSSRRRNNKASRPGRRRKDSQMLRRRGHPRRNPAPSHADAWGMCGRLTPGLTPS